MESQRWRDEINNRCSLLQFNSGKIAIARDFSALQLSANAQPIVRCLQRQMQVLAGLQFNDRQPPGTRYGEEVEDAVFVAGIGKNLSVNKPLIEHGINARDVLANDGFQPALRLSAVERMARIAGQRVAINLQIVQQIIQGGARTGSEFLAGIVDSEKNAAILPAREGQAAEAQPHFARLRCGMRRDSLWRRRDDGIQRGPSPLEERFRFAMWNKPGVQVTRTPGVALFKDIQRWIVLVKLHGVLRAKCGETVSDGAAGVVGKNDTNADEGSSVGRLACALQPE